MADTVVFASTEMVVTLATTTNTATVAATTTTLTLAAAPTDLTVAATTNNINLAATTQLVTVAAVGDQGPPGPSGSTDFTAIAAQALGGQRVCIINTLGQADYATNTTASHKWLAVAISVGAASSGATVTLRTTGLLTEPSWAWTAGAPVYLSTTGLLTQTAPVSPAFLRVIGVATSATTVFIQPQAAIALIA